MTIRLPDYTCIDIKLNSPWMLVQSLKAAHRVKEHGIPGRKTDVRRRAYALTPEAIAYLEERKSNG